MRGGKYGFTDKKHMQYALGGKTRRLDGGINASDMPYALEGNQSPDMLNLWFQDGSLCRRWGQEEFACIEGKSIETLFCDGNGNVYMQSGSTIYRMTIENHTPVVMNTLTVPVGKTKAPVGKFIRSGEDVIFINGVDFLICYDSSSYFSDIEPYVPTVVSECDQETGIGKLKEPFNLLGNVYKVTYNSIYNHIYALPVDVPIGNAGLYAVINGITYQEGRGFSVNRQDNIISFSMLPPRGTNNVELYITRNGANRANDIKACTCGVIYGGDSRLILGGNGTNEVFCSGAFDPSYFPEGLTLPVGNGEAIVGFGQQYDFLAAFKRNEIAYIKYQYTSEKTVLSASVLNPFVGCDIPGSICNVGNRIVFANTENGVCIIAATSRENERNILFISRNIDPLLFEETYEDLINAQAAVFDGRYWLSAGEHVYMWDHSAKVLNAIGGEEKMRALSWYRFDNIPAAAFFSYGRQFYYCRRGDDEHSGKIVRFTAALTDFGETMRAYWRSGMLCFDKPNYYKYIEKVWFIFSGPGRCAAKVRYIFCGKQYEQAVYDAQPITDYELSEGRTHGILRTVLRHVRQKDAVFFAIELDASHDSDMALSDVIVGYSIKHAVK